MRSMYSLFSLAGALLLLTLPARPGQRVIVPGNPPLTSEIVLKTARFTEWVLDVRFTPAQNQEYEQMLARTWKDAGSREATLSMFTLAQKVEAAAPETKQRAQAAMQQELVKGLRQDAQNPNNRWMLDVYEAGHAAASQQPVPATPVTATDGRLLGNWRATTVRNTQYRSTTTGAYAPTNGSSFTLQFRADGTYVHGALVQVTMYNCVSTINGEESGRYRVEGNRLHLEPVKGYVRTANPCAPSQNSEQSKTLGNRYEDFHFDSTQNGEPILVVGGTDGKSRPDYYKREQ